MNFTYVKIGVAIALLLGAFASGWSLRNRDFMDFKREVDNVAKAQDAHNKAVEQQHQVINEGIKNEYEGKLAAVRNYYSGMQLNPSSRPMSGISSAPKGTDAETAYPILAGQCAETTLQVNLWQEWATQNGLIK
jgi:hypothetical protein